MELTKLELRSALIRHSLVKIASGHGNPYVENNQIWVSPECWIPGERWVVSLDNEEIDTEALLDPEKFSLVSVDYNPAKQRTEALLIPISVNS